MDVLPNLRTRKAKLLITVGIAGYALFVFALYLLARRPAPNAGDPVLSLSDLDLSHHFNSAFWDRRRRHNSPDWKAALSVCGAVDLRSRPNCLIVNAVAAAASSKNVAIPTAAAVQGSAGNLVVREPTEAQPRSADDSHETGGASAPGNAVPR